MDVVYFCWHRRNSARTAFIQNISENTNKGWLCVLKASFLKAKWPLS